MPTLSPTTLTQAEQRAILKVMAIHPRDHTIISLALGTGLRLGEIVGLNVGDVYNGKGRPRTRIRVRPEIAKGGKAGDVFLPGKLVVKLRRFRRFKNSTAKGRNRRHHCFATSRELVSRNGGSSLRGGHGRSGRGSIGSIPFIVPGTPLLPMSTGPPETYSWRRGSPGMSRR